MTTGMSLVQQGAGAAKEPALPADYSLVQQCSHISVRYYLVVK
jgi:hypothetical protein